MIYWRRQRRTAPLKSLCGSCTQSHVVSVRGAQKMYIHVDASCVRRALQSIHAHKILSNPHSHPYAHECRA